MSNIEDSAWFVSLYAGIVLVQVAVHVISIGSCLFNFFQSSPRRRLHSAVKSLRPKWWPRSSKIPDPTALIKAKRIEATLVKHGRTTFNILSCLLTLVTVRLVRFGPFDTRKESVNLCQSLLFLTVFSFSTAVVMRPTVLRAETLPYVYIFSMLILLLWGAFSSDCVSFFIRSGHVHLMSIFLGFVWMHFPLIMVVNILGIILQTMMYVRFVSNDAPCNDVLWDLSGFVSSQFFNLILILLISWVACHHTELAVEWEIGRRSDKCLRDGFLSLLKSMCDATVELDSTARLVEHSPALTHMILQRDGASLQGSTLDRWFRSASELSTFKDLIRNAKLEEGQPRTTAWHCDLRSDLGVRIPVQMHVVHFLQMDGTVHHLLGIKEEPEFETLHPLPDIIGRKVEFPSNPTSPCESSLDSEGGEQGFESRPVDDFQIIDPRAEYCAMCHNSPSGCNAFDVKSFTSHLTEWITHVLKKTFEKEQGPWSKDLQIKVSNISSKIMAELMKNPANTGSVALEVFSDLDIVLVNFLPSRRSRLKKTISIYLQIRAPKGMRL